MGVRIISETPASCSEADYVQVSAWCDPEQDTVTLATIQRVVHKQQDGKPAATAKRVKTLIAKQPMSADLALGLARSYAERKGIGLVLSDIRLDAHESPAPTMAED